MESDLKELCLSMKRNERDIYRRKKLWVVIYLNLIITVSDLASASEFEQVDKFLFSLERQEIKCGGEAFFKTQN